MLFCYYSSLLFFLVIPRVVAAHGAQGCVDVTFLVVPAIITATVGATMDRLMLLENARKTGLTWKNAVTFAINVLYHR